MIIDELLVKDNYAAQSWEDRGLIPSPKNVVQLLNSATKIFLIDLRNIEQNSSLNNAEKLKLIQSLVDGLPWPDLDTEEKEFMADVLAPAIKSIGFDPWSIF